MKPLSATLLILLLLVTTALPADPLKRLASVHDFAFGGIGVAGVTSEGELAFREVLKRRAAEADFTTLLDSGNAQARCYALVGLHVLNPKAYVIHARRFEHDNTAVCTIGGCIILTQPMASVVANITAGRYDRHAKN